MNVDIEIKFLSPKGASDDDFEALLESVLDELEGIGREDVELTASLARRTAIFTLFGEGPDVPPSMDRFLCDVRTALHASECGTIGWEEQSTVLRAKLTNGEPVPA